MTQAILWNGGHFAIALIALGAVVLWDRHAPARLFWPVVALLALGLAGIGFEMSDPPYRFEDFRRAYWEAGEAIWGGRSGFDQLYARGTDGFVNIPIVALLFAPFGLLNEIHASIVFTFLGILAVAASWLVLTRHYNLSRRDAAILAIIFAIFGPMLYSLREGNLSHFLLLGMSGALACLAGGRHVAAGLLLGVIAVLKPSLGLIGVYFVLRGQWRVVAGGAAVCIGAGLMSLIVFGWDLNLLWYQEAIAPFAAGPVPAFNAQSLPAFVARFETGLPGLRDWDAHTMSAAGRFWALGLTGLVGLLFLAACLRRGWKPPAERVIELELLLVITVSCLVSSLSWSHYYVWLLPAFIWVWKQADTDAMTRWALAAAFVLCLPLEFLSDAMRDGGFAPLTNVLTSHLLAGGLILFGVLLRYRWRA